jgi:hypothetical protein
MALVKPNFESLHDTQFDELLLDATQFTGDTLGLEITDKSNVAMVSESNANAARIAYGISEVRTGAYDEKTGRVLAFEQVFPDMQITSKLRLGCTTVHELGHSAGQNSDEPLFYNEAFAGIVEYEYLAEKRRSGHVQTAADLMLKGVGVRLDEQIQLPGAYRHVDGREEASAGRTVVPHTGSGLLAALGLHYGQEASGITNAEILEEGKIKIDRAFYLMKVALDALRPGLWKIYKTIPETTAGLVSGTAYIELEARKQELI